MPQSGDVRINVEVIREQFAEAADRIAEDLSKLENALATVRQTNRVVQEVGAQERRWGLQEWPDGTGPGTQPIEGLTEFGSDAVELVCQATARCDAQEAGGGTTWWAILLEEALEAAAERPELDNEDLDRELVQVAAVAVSWLKHRARRRAAAAEGAPADSEPAPEDRVTDHDFQPVNGAPDDDDECAFRNDGTDLTRCGRPRGEHG